jgi:hypothetical protein
LSFIPERENKKMALTNSQDMSTGFGQESPILAGENDLAPAETPLLKHAHQKRVRQNISPDAERELMLSLFQTYLADLQRQGFYTAILASKTRPGVLFVSVEYPGRAIGFEHERITLDGVPVSEAE